MPVFLKIKLFGLQVCQLSDFTWRHLNKMASFWHNLSGVFGICGLVGEFLMVMWVA